MSECIADVLGQDLSDQLKKTETINGVVPAIVTNVKDPENLGRIKVKFPWLEEDNETDWVRVASPYADKKGGLYFLPEVHDEVLVAYQKGNINAPIVIGSLWSNKAKPPEKNADGKNNIKMIKSRAGHQITFDDNSKSKKAKLEIKSSSGHTITINDAAGKEKIEIKDKSGKNKITIDATKKSIDIACDMKLNIKAKMINIEAQSTLTLKSAILKVQSKGIAEIKGAMVKIN